MMTRFVAGFIAHCSFCLLVNEQDLCDIREVGLQLLSSRPLIEFE